MLSLFVLLYVLIIAIFKTIVFFICAISVFFDNMLNKIKSNQIRPPFDHFRWSKPGGFNRLGLGLGGLVLVSDHQSLGLVSVSGGQISVADEQVSTTTLIHGMTKEQYRVRRCAQQT